MSERHACTIQDWMTRGPALVGARPDLEVEITDRRPNHVIDSISPGGGFGWQYGWRWLESESEFECSRWTIPEAIHEHLPACPFAVRKGLMLRWNTAEDAVSALSFAAKAWAKSRRATKPSRRGFTLIELMAVLAITGILLAALAGFAPRWIADLWLTKGAGGVQAEIEAAQAGAALAWGGSPEKAVGVRFLPDPFWELHTLADGTIDRTRPIAYARTVPLVEVGDYRTGRVSIHTDGWPEGFAPAWRRLVLEQSPVDADGLRCEPTTWWWLIRLGDVVTVQGRPYTVCGPTLIPPGPDNVEGFVNWGLPGAFTSPLDRGDGPMEWLYLTNRIDDDGDGFTDDGWDGLDEDLDFLTDADLEWEPERWLNVPVTGLTAAPYSIARRPIAADARTGGDVADDAKTPSPVVIDGTRSTLPVNPFTGSVDIVFDKYGAPSSPSIYGRPTTPPLGVGALQFTLTGRADVATTDPERPSTVVSLDLRSGVVATADGDPMDVAGTLARLGGGGGR